MHSVGSKALTVYAMVAQHMTVKAIIMPHLLDAGILKKLFEDSKQLCVGFLHNVLSGCCSGCQQS